MRPKNDIQLFGKEIVRINGVRFYEGYFQRRRCYGVQQLSTGYAAVFNHRKRILEKLIELVRGGANIGRGGDGNLHIFNGSKKYMTLAEYLYCQYNGIVPTQSEHSNYLRHKAKRRNKLIENCRADNLYIGGVSVTMDKVSDSLLVLSNTKDYIDEFEPIPLLAEIMNTPNTVLYWNECERLMCHIKGYFGFPVADLAYLAYHDKLTMENYIEKLAELKRYKKDNGLNIEHLDSNFHNHRNYNIALVAEGLNSQKCDKILHIKEPYFFTVVTSGRKYKIVVGRADNDLMLDSKLFITEHFENVVGLLSAYRELYPDIFNKAEAAANNKGLFYERFFCEAIANTADEHFIDLDKHITPTEAAESV